MGDRNVSHVRSSPWSSWKWKDSWFYLAQRNAIQGLKVHYTGYPYRPGYFWTLHQPINTLINQRRASINHYRSRSSVYFLKVNTLWNDEKRVKRKLHLALLILWFQLWNEVNRNCVDKNIFIVTKDRTIVITDSQMRLGILINRLVSRNKMKSPIKGTVDFPREESPFQRNQGECDGFRWFHWKPDENSIK